MSRLLSLPPPASARRAGMRLFVILLALGSFWCAAQQKRKPKPPEVEVMQIAARRVEGLVTIDGRVRNSGDRPLRKLSLLFDLLAPGDEVVTRQRGTVEEETLEPGAEAEFHWQMRDPVRAVSLRVQAVDSSGTDLVVRKPGPYPLD